MKIRYVSFAKNYKILTSIISQRKLVKNLSPQEQTAKIAAKEFKDQLLQVINLK